MNRRTFLRTSAGTAAIVWANPFAIRAQTEGRRSSDQILEQAPEKIEQTRKANARITLRDRAGKAVTGATVKIDQLRHDFLFGCNLFGFGRCGNPEVEEQYRARFAALLNFATLGFYWSSYESQRGRPGYDYTDTVLEWTRAKGITCKGHPLVWDHPAGSPRWLTDDPELIQKLSAERVREIVARFKGRIDTWDVVNEATHLPDKVNKTIMAKWALSLGPVPYVARHLALAREVNPDATLLVNDYRIDPPYYRLLEQLQTEKAPFDCVGIQSHMHGGLWPLGKTWTTCEGYAKLGLPLHFTETTVVSGPRKGPGENWGETTVEGEARQADDTVNFYTVLFSHPAVQAITWWDFSDLRAWQRAPAGWLRQDMTPKPVYERLMALIKGAWWTRMNAVSDEQGRFAFRAFYGAHQVAIKLAGGKCITKEIHVSRTSPNNFDFVV